MPYQTDRFPRPSLGTGEPLVELKELTDEELIDGLKRLSRTAFAAELGSRFKVNLENRHVVREFKVRGLPIPPVLTADQLWQIKEAEQKIVRAQGLAEARSATYLAWDTPDLTALRKGQQIADPDRNLLVSFRFARARGYKTVIATIGFLGAAGESGSLWTTDYALLPRMNGKPRLVMYNDELEQEWRPTRDYFYRNGGPVAAETRKHLTAIARQLYEDRQSRRRARKATRG